MNIIRMYRSRKYLLRILLSISLLLAVALLISSAVQYSNFRAAVLESQLETNRKIMHQINYNINYMNELIKTLTMAMYFDPDTISLMNSRTFDIFELTPKLNRLYKNVNSTAFIESILIYNAHNGCYYGTTSRRSCPDDGLGREMDRFLERQTELPRLKLIPFPPEAAGTEGGRIEFFSYFMFESVDGRYDKQSTFMINIKPEWLFDNVDEINRLADRTESHILIMDESGRLYNSGGMDGGVAAALARTVRDREDRASAADDSPVTGPFMQQAGDQRVFVTHMTSDVNGWMIVNVQSYASVMGQVDKMRNASIATIAVFVFLALLVSVVVSLKLYQPIEKVLKQIKRSAGEEATEDRNRQKDELTLISDEYQFAMERMETFEKSRNATSTIVKAHHLRRLIADSSLVLPHEFEDDLKPNRLNIALGERMILVVLKIDNYTDFHSKWSNEEKKLVKFAISNIAGEIIGQAFPNEIVDMRTDHVVAILNAGPDAGKTGKTEQAYTDLLKTIQRYIWEYYHISITVAVSPVIERYQDITKNYVQTTDCAMYRLVYGKMSIIVPEMVARNRENRQFQFPSEAEKRWVEALRANDAEQAAEALAALMQHISQLSYTNMMYSLFHLVVILNSVISEINKNSLNQISIDLHAFYRTVVEQETLEEIASRFVALFHDIGEKRDSVKGDDKNDIIADTIREIIEENYRDPNLSLQGIAGMMKMSAAHVSKVFRIKHGSSIAEFITEIRLNHSLKLLEQYSYSINEIMDKVGFCNQSYFFKLFKKRFGTTPKEYRIKRMTQ